MTEHESRPKAGDEYSALFAHLVLQQSNMAMMLLGKVPHPESGEVIKDMEAARLFIDQLEMLEVKTKGNLSKEEAGILKQSLMTLHMAFVEAVQATPTSDTAQPSTPAESARQSETTSPPQEAPPASDEASADEHRKKFSKKY
jgi:Domain of unknown function (DUF1844)